MPSTSRTRQRSRSAPDRANRQTGTEPPARSVEEHSEHPEHPGDPTVRHAGRGSFPEGEYDITKPKSSKGKPTSVRQTLIEQHYAAGGLDVETIQKAIKHPNANRLAASERELALELMPVGTILEHEAQNRWRVHVAGQNRYGHGSTAKEAIDSWVLGNGAINETAAAAQRFNELPASVKAEIIERNRAAAKSTGQVYEDTAEAVAFQEAVNNQKAAQKRDRSPISAGTEGPEVASAINKAGRERSGARKSPASASRNRSSARRRSGGKAKAGKK